MPTNISGKREHIVGGSGGSNKNSRGDDSADRPATSVRRGSVPVNPSTISRHRHQNQSQASDIITPPRNSSRRNKRSRGEDNDGPTHKNQSPTITSPNSSSRTVAKANLRHIAKTSDIWTAATTTCFSLGLHPNDAEHKPVICDGCKEFYQGKLKYNIENHMITVRGRRLACQRPWGCPNNAMAGKIDARNKIFSLFAPADISQGVAAAEAIAPAVLSPVSAEMNKTKPRGGAVKYFDANNRMTLVLTARIAEKMEGRTSLESHEVEVLNCLQNIHSHTNKKEASKPIKILKEFLDNFTPTIKEKKTLSNPEKRLLGQLAVIAFRETQDADFISLRSI